MTLPVSPISAFDLPVRVPAPGGDLHSLGQRFEQMMAAAPPAVAPLVPQATNAATPFGSAVMAMDATQHQLDVDMGHALAAAPGMDMHSLTVMQTSLTLEMAIASSQLTLATSLVQSGKSSLTTLMKNQ